MTENEEVEQYKPKKVVQVEIHIEEYYKPEEFLMTFIKKEFNITAIDFKALLEAFKEKYGEPKI